MKDTSRFRGTGVALITPFKGNGRVDFASLEEIIEYTTLSGGVDYIVLLGTTGESVTLTTKEKVGILESAKELVYGNFPIVLGLGGNATHKVLNSFKNFDFNGIDAILSVSPYYNRPSQEGIKLHYEAIADKSPVPIILYNVPSRTGSNILAETTLRLAEHENIIGIKEASGNTEQCEKIIQNRPSDFLVISGNDNVESDLLSKMDGVISVIANAFPVEFGNHVRIARKGKVPDANKLHKNSKLNLIIEAIFKENSPAGIKALMHIKGLCENVLRLPLTPVSKENYNLIKSLAV